MNWVAVLQANQRSPVLLWAAGNESLATAMFGVKHFDPDETRTRNLLIRSQTPYPLGHEAMSRCTPSPGIRPLLVKDLANLPSVPFPSPDHKPLGAAGTDWRHDAHLYFAKTPPTPGIEPGPPA